MIGLDEMLEQWGEEAHWLRRHGQGQLADFLECKLDELARLQKEQSDKFITIAEAATLSGYSEAHLRRLVRSGRLPSAKMGRNLLVSLPSLPQKPLSSRPHLSQSEVLQGVRAVIERTNPR